jgi:hypothetical protein
MNILSARHLKQLIEAQQRNCISLYMPTGRRGPEIRQNPIRFKNLLQKIERKLEKKLRTPEVESLLEPAYDLLGDSRLWEFPGDGLAVFLSPEMVRYYRLPMPMPKLVIVADRFHIKPLVPMLSGDGRFYLLALSLNQVKLFQCTHHSVLEVHLEKVPTSLEKALRYDDPERQLQYHTGTPGKGGKRAAVYHGQGVGVDEAQHKKEILRFFQQLDKGLHEVLPEGRAPLVLAGVEYLLPIFRRASDHSAIVEEHIPGNPQEQPIEKLHRRAWSLVEPIFLKGQQSAIDRYLHLSGASQASAEIAEIVPAAFYDRVDTLFVARGRQRWGSFDPASGSVRLGEKEQSGEEDLLDTAAAYTLINGGTVYAPEPEKMPRQTLAAAVFRFPAEGDQ